MIAITRFVGASERAAYHPRMSKKPLTPQEIAAAHAIREAVRLSGRSQDDIAAELGVSQGLIWQWASARVPVPANRAVATLVKMRAFFCRSSGGANLTNAAIDTA